MLAPTGPATSAASDRSGTHQRRRKGSCGDGNSSEAEAEWHEGALQTLRHAARVRAPSPARTPMATAGPKQQAASPGRWAVGEGPRRFLARHGRARQLILAGGREGARCWCGCWCWCWCCCWAGSRCRRCCCRFFPRRHSHAALFQNAALQAGGGRIAARAAPVASPSAAECVPRSWLEFARDRARSQEASSRRTCLRARDPPPALPRCLAGDPWTAPGLRQPSSDLTSTRSALSCPPRCASLSARRLRCHVPPAASLRAPPSASPPIAVAIAGLLQRALAVAYPIQRPAASSLPRPATCMSRAGATPAPAAPAAPAPMAACHRGLHLCLYAICHKALTTPPSAAAGHRPPTCASPTAQMVW